MNALLVIASAIGLLATAGALATGNISFPLAVLGTFTFLGTLCAAIYELTKD